MILRSADRGTLRSGGGGRVWVYSGSRAQDRRYPRVCSSEWISLRERDSVDAEAFSQGRGRAWHGERVRQAAGRIPVLRRQRVEWWQIEKGVLRSGVKVRIRRV
jgi:hypothetical protein